MEGTTYNYIKHAQRRFDRAEVKLAALKNAAWQLHRPEQSEEKLFVVEELILEWALHIRQMFVFIDKAIKSVEATPELGEWHEDVKSWWAHIETDSNHKYFKWVRNHGFKEGVVVIREEWLDDPDLGQLGYFALAGGPMDGDPFIARSQQYMDWAYNEVLSEARIKLFNHFREEMAAEFATRRSLL